MFWSSIKFKYIHFIKVVLSYLSFEVLFSGLKILLLLFLFIFMIFSTSLFI